MTAQASDRITIDGIGWRLLGEPLEEYLSENFQEYPFVAPHTANWRGYTAEWRIQDGDLWLVDLVGWVLRDRDMVQVQGGEALGDGRTLPVKADWATGQWRIARGDVANYVHAGYHSEWEHERLLVVEYGLATVWRAEGAPEWQSWLPDHSFADLALAVRASVIGEPVQPGRLFVPSGLRAIESLHAMVDALAGTVNHYASAWVQPEEDWEVSVFVGPSNFRGEVGFQVSMFSMDPVPEPDFVEPDNDGHVWEDLEETIEAHIHAAWNEAAGLGLAVALDHLDEAVSLLDAYSDPDPDMQERVVDTAGHVLATLQVILAHVEEAYGGDWAS